MNRFFINTILLLFVSFAFPKDSIANEHLNIAINPGHGAVNDEATNAWFWQRDIFHDLREDLITPEFAIILNKLLKEEEFTTHPLREMNKRAGLGESGQEKWKESAKDYLKARGDIPEEIWNTSNTDDFRIKDIYARTLYPNYIGVDALVSIHTNGSIAGDETGEGDKTGTETFYCRKLGYGYEDESIELANAVHYSIIKQLRERYDPNWHDGNIWGSFHSENCRADSPAIIVEVAFHDNSFPDSDYLKDHHFRQIVAEAIRDGIKEYFLIESFEVAPQPPAIVNATDGYINNAIGINWVVTPETKSYRLYRCQDTNIDSCVEIYSGSSFYYSDADSNRNTFYYYRVKSCNTAGCSAIYSEYSSGFKGDLPESFNVEQDEITSLTGTTDSISQSGGTVSFEWLFLLALAIFRRQKLIL